MGRAGSNLFLLHNSLRPSLYNLFSTTHLCNFIKRYSHQARDKEELKEDFLHLARDNDPVGEEKARSADAKFERVSKKKARADEETKAGDQGFASQTLEKVQDGSLNSDYKVEAVKNRYKEHEPGANYHKTGD